MTYDRRESKAPGLTKPLHALLLKIDNGDYHGLPADGVNSVVEKRNLDALVARHLIRFVPEGNRFPAHYVLTAAGSHAIETFRFTTMASRVAARFLAS
jgi:hypothetical protein